MSTLRRLMKLFLPYVTGAVAFATLAAGVPPAATRPAWLWTNEDRIAERLDPAAIRARIQRNAADRQQLAPHLTGNATGVPQADAIPANVIVGAANPELFLPFELYPHLLWEALSDSAEERRATRERLAPIIGARGADDAFWRALEQTSSELRANEQMVRLLAGRLHAAASEADRALIRQQLAGVQRPACGLRAAALDRLELAVGRDVLYRVLYEGIAPEMAMESREQESASKLRFIAGGCK